MEFFDLIQKRYSVRAYQSTPIEDEKLTKILEAARIAPTAANRQPFQIIILKTANRKSDLQRLYHREWFVQAPLVIGICGTPESGWVRGGDKANYTSVDVAIAMDHLILAAANLGLGTCWIANFNPEVAREILELPPEVEPMAFTPLGYPADEPRVKVRKALNDLVRYEKW